jgi:hypothetical protein
VRFPFRFGPYPERSSPQLSWPATAGHPGGLYGWRKGFACSIHFTPYSKSSLINLDGPQPSYAKVSEGLIVSPPKLQSSQGGSRAKTMFVRSFVLRAPPHAAIDFNPVSAVMPACASVCMSVVIAASALGCPDACASRET